MYILNQAASYQLGLHISKAVEIKIVADKVCPRLPIWDVVKKGNKLYYNEKIPSRRMKVEVLNYSRNWSSLFSGKKLVHALDAYDTKTFWN